MANSLHQRIVEEAHTRNLDPLYVLATAKQESNFNPSLRSSTSSAFGLFQFIDENWKDYGIDPRSADVINPETQIKHGVDRVRRYTDALTLQLGRSPEPHEQYMAHVFGLRGGGELIAASDDANPRQFRPEKVFTANPWIDANGLNTIGKMKAWFRSKMQTRMAEVSTLADPTALLSTTSATTDAPRATSPSLSELHVARRLTEKDIPNWPLQNVLPEELRSKDGAPLDISMKAASAFDGIRAEFGSPIPVLSGQRSHGRNAAVSGAKDSRHIHGDAFDVDLSSLSDDAKQRFLLLAMKHGFTSFGFYTKNSNTLHLDMRDDARAWFYGTDGKNVLKFAEGVAQNFPKQHWAAEIMTANFQLGRGGLDKSASDPRFAGASTITEARNRTSLPGVTVPSTGTHGVELGDTVPRTPFTTAERQEIEQKRYEERPGFFDAMRLAAQSQWGILWAYENATNQFARDPKWEVSPDYIKQNLGTLPPRFWDGIQDTVSEVHAKSFVEKANRAYDIEQKLGSLGFGGIAAQLVAAMVDPVSIGATALTDGALAPLLYGGKLSRLTRGTVAGLSAGAVNAGVESFLYSQKPGAELSDILFAGLGGFALGSAFAAARRGLNSDAEEALSQAGLRAQQNVLSQRGSIITSKQGSAGAAVNPLAGNAPINRNADELYDEAAANRTARSGEAVTASLDFSAAGRTLNSEHALAANTMDLLASSAIGRSGDGVNTLDASLFQGWMQRHFENRFFQKVVPAFEEYAQGRGLNRFQLLARRDAWTDFNEQITRSIRDPQADGISPQAMKVSTSIQDDFEDILSYLKEPGQKDGILLPPVKGFDTIEFNRQYIPRIFHPAKVRQMRDRFADDAMTKFWAQAWLARNPSGAAGSRAFVDNIELAGKFGKLYWKRVQANQTSPQNLGRPLSGEDTDLLRAELKEALTPDGDISEADIDAIVNQLNRAQEGGYARAKQRAMIDENFSAEVQTKDGSFVRVSVADFLENRADDLFAAYVRNMSGAVAMARAGFDNVAAFETRLKHIKDTAHKAKDYSQDKLTRDLENLSYIATYITGSPVGDFGKALFNKRNQQWAKVARVVRDLNFTRLMGQLGFAQAAETFNILGYTGLNTAFTAMPGLRALMRNMKTGQLDDELAHELESFVGLGSDRLRGSASFRHEDFGTFIDPDDGRLLAKTEELLRLGKYGVNELSGANFVNTVLQRWAMRAVAQKFANMAHDGAQWSARRLASYGLDQKAAQRVFSEIKKHGEFTESVLSNRKLVKFNLENWEPETQEAFTQSMFRIGRYIIQENDAGAFHRYLSSPAAQIIAQFRNFMIAAHTKQLLHGVHNRDAYTVMAFMGTMVSAGIAYMLQTYGQSIGKSDRQKFLDEKLSLQRIAAASFSRAGWAALVPTAIDNAAAGFGFKAPFDARTSGLSASGLFQNPTFDFIERGARGVFFGPASAAFSRDYDYSQQDWAKFWGVVPFANTLPIATGIHLTGRLFPEKSRER